MELIANQSFLSQFSKEHETLLKKVKQHHNLKLYYILLGCEFSNDKVSHLTNEINNLEQILKTNFLRVLFTYFDNWDNSERDFFKFKNPDETEKEIVLNYFCIDSQCFETLIFYAYETRRMYHALKEQLSILKGKPLKKESYYKSKIKLKQGAKVDLIRIIVAMYDNGFFESETKQKVDLINVMKSLGDVLGMDLSDYQNNLSDAFNSKIETNLKVFDTLKQAIQKRYNKRLEK
jgi:hypothetical protein